MPLAFTQISITSTPSSYEAKRADGVAMDRKA
jgi:hypothetical protein